eukprot:maker-scaffold256_size235750-snap-gene-0.9 protein:Tk08125 transcript:maker-scaffold256_size235750-snap-gene-0.9-mRNA-1 annotation:"hermansky-pudlak syndrome 3 protein"
MAQLTIIRANFQVVVHTITSLEERLPLVQSMLVEKLKLEPFATKLADVLSKNPSSRRMSRMVLASGLRSGSSSVQAKKRLKILSNPGSLERDPKITKLDLVKVASDQDIGGLQVAVQEMLVIVQIWSARKMVRVISVHHFSKQDVSQCSSASAMVMAGSTTFVLATDSQVLEVRDLRSGASTLCHSFQTIDRVTTLLHCPVGNYLATLEGLPGDDGASVRVYLNWHDPKVNNAPIKPRIASHVSPSSQSGDNVHVDMIEFPQRDCPYQIAVCASTGNLMVASANLLIVYKYQVKVHEATRVPYIDFHECFHVFHNFVPKEIALCEDVIACLSDHEVHVFKVKISDSNTNQNGSTSSMDDERNLRSISVYSFTSDSEPASMVALDGGARRGSISGDDTDSERDGSCSTLRNGATIKNITQLRQQDSENGDDHLQGYVGNVRRHPSHVILNDPRIPMVHLPEITTANREFASLIGTPRILEQSLGPCAPPLDRQTTIKYIHHHADPSARGGDFEAECVTLVHCRLTKSEEGHDLFKNLNVKPVFWKEFRVRKSVGATAAISTPGNGPAFNVIQHPLQSMFHVHLMSITACFTSQNEGYLYHLPGHLRKAGKGCGIQRIATYPFTSPVGQIALEPTLLHALTETGLETYTLRSGYHTVLEAENVNNKTSACPITDDNPICLVGLRPFIGAQLLTVSDARLVILARSDGIVGLPSGGKTGGNGPDQWTLYSLTLPTPVDIHKDMMQLATMNKVISPQGFFQLLAEAHMVLRTSLHQLAWAQATGKNRNLDEDLVQTRSRYKDTCLELADYFLTCEDVVEWMKALPYYRMSGRSMNDILKHTRALWAKRVPPGLIHYLTEAILKPSKTEAGMDASLADEIIDLLGQRSLETLAKVVLKSPTFRGFKTQKIVKYFKDWFDTHASESGAASLVLAYAVLSVDVNQTDHVRDILVRTKHAIALSMSSILIEQHDMLLDTSTSSEGMLFLETYFIEELGDTDALTLDLEQEQAVQTLVRSYLTSLSVPVRFGDKDIDTDMFGNRFEFLDKLPPFKDDNSTAKESLKGVDSPEFWCQNSLLKLQSLLCSHSLALPSCKRTVLGFLEMYPMVVGGNSLRILCSESGGAMGILCRDHPAILLPYAKETSLSLDDWQVVLACLQDQLNSDHDHPSHEAWYSAMQEVLDHLAHSLSLDDFLQILPGGPHANEEFQGFIQMCRKNQQANDIQNLIEIALCEDVIACLSDHEVHVFKVKISDSNTNQNGSTSSMDDERNLRSISVYSFTSDSEPASMVALDGGARRGSISGDDTDSERDGSCSTLRNGATIKNITQLRQQDSENGDDHLQGYVGNVRRHPSHVILNDPRIPMVHLPEITTANREFASLIGTPRILEQSLGPCAPPLDRQTTIKYIHHHADPSARGGDFEAECVTLVHCRLTKSEEGHDLFKNLNVKPVFWKEFRVRKSVGATAAISTPGNGPAFNVIQHPLQSMFHVHLMSITACFTSQNEGYLYHLPGHLRKAGKGCGIQRIATYPFTSPVGQIALEPTLLHALTETGLETYTLRSGYHTVLEAENVNNKTSACPITDDNPICLVGLRPFIGAQLLTVSDARLVILARSDGIVGLPSGGKTGGNGPDQWTLYSLTLPTPVDIHKDMMQLATMNKVISPQGFFQLLAEAHMVLRTSLHQLAWAQATGKNRNLDEDLVQTRSRYKDTCLELADYFLTCEDVVEWMKALPYYRMSGRSMNDILKHTRALWAKRVPPGLIHYLTEAILKPSKTEAGMDASLADEIIDLLGQRSLETLAKVVLKSPTFRGFKTQKIVKYFKDWFDTHASESGAASLVLAYAVLSVDVNQTDHVRDILVRTKHAIALSMSSILIEQHDMLLDTSTSSEGMLFLETYFIEELGDTDALTLDLEQEQAVQTLVRSYLTSLSVPVRFGDKDIDTDMFGNRFEFLDKLPPFKDDNSTAKESLKGVDSPEFWCQNSLLKLQSLLCSHSLALPSCKRTVLGFLEMYPMVVGGNSLRILCSESGGAMGILCRDHPAILLPYAKETSLSLDDWQVVLACLQDQLNSDHDHPSHEAWYSAMQEVLDHLAHSLSLDDFLQILPGGPHANEEFQGFIQMCRKNQQANDIQNLI